MTFWQFLTSIFSPKPTMKRIIGTLEGQDIHHEIAASGYETAWFYGDMDIDCDGSGGNPDNDPYFQSDTTLHYKGQPLNAQTVPFIVVPPIVIKATRGVVLGALAEVTYKGKTVHAVVGDLGPTRKVGEGSPALAKLLGINPNANHGGVDEQTVLYKIHVGVPAVINGITYDLQPWRS
jgi:hypothetical protein